ncbi:MAG: Mth938-like domain-containing protein [Pseudomonadota bacterium]
MQIQFNIDPNDSQYTIRSYVPGALKVNEQIYNKSIIISNTMLNDTWSPQCFDAIKPEHLDMLCEASPAIIILGTGEHQRFLKPELMQIILAKGIGLECMTTLAACRTYNVLMSEQRHAVAGLLIR